MAQEHSSAYSFGYTVLGPVFAAFALLLVREAHKRNIRRLVFLARDGDLLMRVTARLLERRPAEARPDLLYLHLSRRVAALAALPTMDIAAIEAASAVRAGKPSLGKCLEFHGLDITKLEHWLDKHGFNADTALPSHAALAPLLADPEFQQAVASQSAEQKTILREYLDQAGLAPTSAYAWVDIGWRGSIQTCVASALADTYDENRPYGFYLCLWSDEESAATFPNDGVGLIGDRRRGRDLREGAAWYAAHLLEAICRAPEGTTLGLRRTQGRIVPTLAEDSNRGAEISCADLASNIRSGILDRVDNLAADLAWIALDDKTLRNAAQRLLLRMAFFPSPAEIDIGRRLYHTEGHASEWQLPLVLPGSNPIRSPRLWLAGLASPWRAGYVAATGGRLMAGIYALAEAVLLFFPPGLHRLVANAARHLAGISPAARHTAKPYRS